MKYLLIGLLFFGSWAQANAQTQTFQEREIIYDKVFQKAMYVERIRGETYYIRFFRGIETEYPRYARDLAKRVKSYGTLKEGMEVTFFNRNDRRWYNDEIKYVFDGGIAFFDKFLGAYAVGEYYLGVPVSKIPNSKVQVGDSLCSIKRTTHLRAGGEKGTVMKLFSNGSVKMKFKDFFVVNAYEIVPLDNLRPCR